MNVWQRFAPGWCVWFALGCLLLSVLTLRQAEAGPLRSSADMLASQPDMITVENAWIDSFQTFVNQSPDAFPMGYPQSVCMAPAGSNSHAVDCIHYVSPDSGNSQIAIVDQAEPGSEVATAVPIGDFATYSSGTGPNPALDAVALASLKNPIACDPEAGRCGAQTVQTGAPATGGDDAKPHMTIRELIRRIPAIVWGAVLLIAVALLRG